jgi:transposase
VPPAPSSYGPNLKALAVYLVIYQHVPVQRCVQLIADLGGRAPSAGFVHGMLARCAAGLAEVVTLIKTMVAQAAVAGFDETPIRCGPAGQKKYVLSASTETAVAYHLGGRDLGRSGAGPVRRWRSPQRIALRCCRGRPGQGGRTGR